MQKKILMGKPFKQELERLVETYVWAMDQDVSELHNSIIFNKEKPLFIVGSGGSLSVCYYMVALYQKTGTIAKAITPLEVYYSKEALRGANILFISASGRNTDILFAYKTALLQDPANIFCICMKKNSPLANLCSKSTISKIFEFNNPVGKDGFLATNSLIGFFSILYKLYGGENTSIQLSSQGEFKENLTQFCNLIKPNYTFVVLHGGWGQPVAIDLESKFSEAALADILITDYRNFGHGRHHWFAKRSETSAIVALVTPSEAKLARKTLELLPKNIPTLYIESDSNDAFASIDLLVKSFHLVNHLGEIQSIDPGRPGVPDYGRKLYHLKYASFYPIKSDSKISAIIKKANIQTLQELSEDDLKYWSNAYDSFTSKLSKAKFGSVVFDYDGTLCSGDDRYNKGINLELANRLAEILKRGFLVGIITGRGKSAREALQESIEKKYWKNVIIGYYNGSDIDTLENNDRPDKKGKPATSLKKISDELTECKFPTALSIELKPNQLTIEINDKKYSKIVKSIITQKVMLLRMEDIEVLESSHSIDIINKKKASKLNILEYCAEKANELGIPNACLCIGDKGQWPGNDYQLLSTPYSLSVDEVSGSPNSCWFISEPGSRNTQATLEYLSQLQFNKKSFNFNIK